MHYFYCAYPTTSVPNSTTARDPLVGWEGCPLPILCPSRRLQRLDPRRFRRLEFGPRTFQTKVTPLEMNWVRVGRGYELTGNCTHHSNLRSRPLSDTIVILLIYTKYKFIDDCKLSIHKQGKHNNLSSDKATEECAFIIHGDQLRTNCN